MKNSIAAIRMNYLGAGIALTLLFFVALLSFQNSSGVVRDSGGDDGSGIGGTGVVPGESGFGGTGLKPFLGMNQSKEYTEIVILPGTGQGSFQAISDRIDISSLETLDMATRSIPAPQVTSAQFRTHDSSPINITEAIQVTLNESASISPLDSELPTTTKNQQTTIGDNYIQAEPTISRVQQNELESSDPTVDAQTFEIAESLADRQAPSSMVQADQSSVADDPGVTNWNRLTDYLVDESARLNVGASVSTGRQQVSSESRTTLTRKIHRPELPPIQRIRPVERLSVLPPRIQPLQL